MYVNVKPAPGKLLRDPVTKQLLSAAPVDGVKTTVVPDEGMQVHVHDLYWVRRLRDGDAVRADAKSVSTTAVVKQDSSTDQS
ncbi:DUF2635 domain-containing protein [Paraburkholderia sp. BR14263]|uniref:DUF2635 domain-containing protein n=1 Tax=unclassified Paraburkholderia TaxID=2615204 RepID=UPI0034CE1AE0